MRWIGTYASYNSDLIEVFCNEIKAIESDNKIRLLEPMCGSGNLLVQLEKKNVSYTAYDINPVQVIQCNAKLALTENLDVKMIRKDLKALRVKEFKKTIVSREWIHPEVKILFSELYNSLFDYSKDKGQNTWDILYASLILALRRNACTTTSSNPTWLKKGGTIPGTMIKKTLIEAYDYIINWQDQTYPQNREKKHGTVSCKDIRKLSVKSQYDICITSPPYCNRLDYKRMFAPEYYFINNTVQNNNKDDDFIGSNKIHDFDVDSYEPTKYEGRLLNKIREQQMPENKDYYYKYYLKYFAELDHLLIKILDALKTNGILLITIQNSHYKDVSIDLDQIIINKIKEDHIVSELISRKKSFFGNLLKVNERQKETLLKIVKK